MRKLIPIVCGLAAVALVACGSDPSTPTGTLPKVEGLTVVDSLCSGTDVFLSWSPVDSAIGYRVYYDESGLGNWGELKSVEDTFTVHSAERAYYYTVLAFTATNTSEDYADRASTRPNYCGSYLLHDNYASADSANAIVFGANAGVTGRADDTTFAQNAYTYDGGWAQSPIGLYTGDAGVWGNGVETPMQRSNSGLVAPEAGYDEDSIYIIDGDYVYFQMPDSHYVKVWVEEVVEDTTVTDTTYFARIRYQYQPIEGLRLFSYI
jgi:hypothetical protein